LQQKAERGELYSLLPSGYYLSDDGRYEMEPNARVQKTIQLVFDSGRDGQSFTYFCRGNFATTGEIANCFSISARKLEQAVVDEVLKTIRWSGGVHSEIHLPRQAHGQSRQTSREVVELVKELVVITDDKDIARILNRGGLKTGVGQNWNQARVKWLRQTNDIPAFSERRAAAKDAINLRQAAEQLQISPDALLRLIKAGVIAAKQIVRYAPWMIPRAELEKTSVHAAVASIKKNEKANLQINPQQLTLENSTEGV